MTDDLRHRSADEVFDDHLRLAGQHRFADDIERNVSRDIVILECRGIFRGRQGATELARLLEQELPNAPYFYANRLVDGRVAFLEWTAESEHARVRDGADSFLIEMAGSSLRTCATRWNRRKLCPQASRCNVLGTRASQTGSAGG
jgi:hypothetical protein